LQKNVHFSKKNTSYSQVQILQSLSNESPGAYCTSSTTQGFSHCSFILTHIPLSQKMSRALESGQSQSNMVHVSLLVNGTCLVPMRKSASSSQVMSTTHSSGQAVFVAMGVVVVGRVVVVGNGSQWQQVSPSSTNFMFLYEQSYSLMLQLG